MNGFSKNKRLACLLLQTFFVIYIAKLLKKFSLFFFLIHSCSLSMYFITFLLIVRLYENDLFFRHECPGCHKGFNRQDNMKVHTKNCAVFLADPELAKLLPTRKFKASQNRRKTAEPLLNSDEIVNITVKVEPTVDPDVNIKLEPMDDSD